MKKLASLLKHRAYRRHGHSAQLERLLLKKIPPRYRGMAMMALSRVFKSVAKRAR
jgi:hypothetical protein